MLCCENIFVIGDYMKKKTIQNIIIIVCILLILGGVAWLAKDWFQSEKNHEIYDEMLQGEDRDGDEMVEEVVVEQGEEKKVYVPKKLKRAMKKYEDAYAWISIEDTNVDYPIVQHPTSNAYYLEHTIDGVKGYPGSIYTERYNAKDFSDFNTVIYGHDMINGTMFKHLHKFEDKKFFKQHDTITIYTAQGELTYKIFAAVTYDDRHLMRAFNYDKKKERQEFLDSIFGLNGFGNHYRKGVEVNADSHIITLSTCISNKPDHRYLVLGVLVEEEEKE